MNKNRLYKLLCVIILLICIVSLLLSSSGCGCDNRISNEKEITFFMGEANAKSGEKGVALTVAVKNNPGFASARFEIKYDDTLTLTGFTYNTSKLDGASTIPYNQKTNPPCMSVTKTDGNITGDFDFATLYFDVSDKAEKSCEVTISCKEGDVYDIDENNIDCNVTSGKINISSSKNPTEATSSSETKSNSDSKETHTVVFKDENGKVILTQTVKDGDSVPAPTAPPKAGFVFKGWSESIDKVTSDKTIIPVYEPIGSAPAFEIEKVQASKGDKNVEVNVSIKNNPGVASISFDVLYDTDKLKLTGFKYNNDLIKGSSTVPFNEKASTPCLSMVNGAENVTGDGVFATLFFEVSEDADGGYPIIISYDKNNVYNIDEENVSFEIVNGLIEIK